MLGNTRLDASARTILESSGIVGVHVFAADWWDLVRELARNATLIVVFIDRLTQMLAREVEHLSASGDRYVAFVSPAAHAQLSGGAAAHRAFLERAAGVVVCRDYDAVDLGVLAGVLERLGPAGRDTAEGFNVTAPGNSPRQSAWKRPAPTGHLPPTRSSRPSAFCTTASRSAFPAPALPTCAPSSCASRARTPPGRRHRPSQHAAADTIIALLALGLAGLAYIVSPDRFLARVRRQRVQRGSGARGRRQPGRAAGRALFFLVSIQARLKRRRALAALHELRTIIHVIDMHQLTKDPSTAVSVGGKTPSSPARRCPASS